MLTVFHSSSFSFRSCRWLELAGSLLRGLECQRLKLVLTRLNQPGLPRLIFLVLLIDSQDAAYATTLD